MGNAFVRTKGYSRLFEDVNFENHWIQELLKYPKLRTEIMKLWAEFSRSYKVENFTDKIDRYANYIKPAWNEPEKERWPDYNIDFSWFPAYLKREFTAHFNLIDAWYRTLPEFYVYAPSSNQNTSGGAGGWKILGSFIGQPNCDYVAVVENLPTTFKIASADGVSFVLGPADAAKSIKQGEECALEEKANVFKSLNSYDKAVITYNPAKKTLVVDDASFAKVENIVNDAKDFTVNGTTVSALDHVCIYDLAGVTVATLSPGSSIVLAAGVYLVKGSSTISKIMVR